MSMYKNITDIINVLNFDEILLRLLYYSPANLATNTLDPLNILLQNVMDMDEETQWNIRNERIKVSDKTDDLIPDKPMCRILLYAGRRLPVRSNYMFADQEFHIDIFCHNSFEDGDFRLEKISDRLNELFVSERITGIGKMEYLNGNILSSPREYVGFKHIYKFGSFSK